MKTFIVSVVTLIGAAGCNGATPTPPPSTPTDVAAALKCVIDDVVAQRSVDDCIALYGQQLVSDLLQTLGDSKAFSGSKFALEQRKALKP
jgi:hypothetical protein